MIIDSHCHIHELDYPLPVKDVLLRARKNGVNGAICIGTDYEKSQRALAFVKNKPNFFATIGVHPHYADQGIDQLEQLIKEHRQNPQLVAIGEIGLDYHYNYSDQSSQQKVLCQQIELALKYNLPIVFHIREAFADFWPIFDSYAPLRGVVHSFSDHQANVEEALKRGLYIGVNGLATFTKDQAQQEAFNSIPLDRLLVETDAPYLTPHPFRGKVNELRYAREVVRYFSATRNISEEVVASATAKNTEALFQIKFR